MHKIYFLLLFIILSINSFAQKQYELETSKIEVSSILENITAPWEIIYAPDNYIWMTHENGTISRVHPETGIRQEVLSIPDKYSVDDKISNRIVGITIGSNFNTIPYVYINYVYKGEAYTSKNWNRYEKIVRFKFDFENQKLIEPIIILDGIKVYDGWRIGGKLLISPDNQYLFLSVGDAKHFGYPQNHPEWTSNEDKSLSLESISGKIIRIKTDGTVPKDNPFYISDDKNLPRNLIWSKGHRNPQGLTFGPDNKLYYTEHGEENNDEFGPVIKGGNCGWPKVRGICDTEEELEYCKDNPDHIDPIYTWVSSIAPSNMVYYNHDAIPEWKNSVLIGTLTGNSGVERAGEDIRVLNLSVNGSTVKKETIMFDQEYHRIRDLCVSSDGNIFFVTSNSILGQGNQKLNDDKLYRIRALNDSSFNNPPTDIQLSNNDILEGKPNGTLVGLFSTTDPDDETHEYSLVSGSGDDDNSFFKISGNKLASNSIFNHHEKSVFSIRVKSEDAEGESFEKQFLIEILTEPENIIRIEVEESNFIVLSDVGENGVVEVWDEPINNEETKMAVILPDKGDKMQINFTLPSAGKYAVRIVTRSGDKNGKLIFWFDDSDQPKPLNNYIFQLNGRAFKIAGDKSCPELFESDMWGGSHWGPMINTIPSLGSGEHEMTIEANTGWLGVDYIEFEKVPSVVNRFEMEDDNFTVDADEGDKGIPRILFEETIYDCQGGQAVMLWDNGDKISTSFNIAKKGKYKFNLRVRTGDAAGNKRLANNYQVFLNNELLSLELDENTVLTQETWGKSSWGVLSTNLEQLDTGNHEIAISVKSSFLGVDYYEIIPLSVEENNPPTDITLSNFNIKENQPIGTLIGTFKTTDLDENDTHTYSIVGENSAFFIDGGNKLISNTIFNFKSKNTYLISIKVIDKVGLSFKKDFEINIIEDKANHPPSDLLLSNNTISENRPTGTEIGQLSTIDQDIESHEYSLVPGEGDEDNKSFEIDGNILKSKMILDFNQKQSYKIRISSTDESEAVFEKKFEILVLQESENHTPTDISLSKNTILENQPVGKEIGEFTTVDEDEDYHFYALVEGEGSEDNNAFKLVENKLSSRVIFDFNIKSSFNIRVQTNDRNGGFFEKTFEIKIIENNNNYIPSDINLSNSSVLLTSPLGTFVGKFTSEDENKEDTHAYSLVNGIGDGDNTKFRIIRDSLKTGNEFNDPKKNKYFIRVQTEDSQGGKYQKLFTIDLIGENLPPIVKKHVPDQTFPAGTNFKFRLDSDMFYDPDDDNLIFSVKMGNGKPIPGWMVFNSELLSFECNPSLNDVGLYPLVLGANDDKGGEVLDSFNIIIEKPLSLEDDDNIEAIKIYPNPVIGNLKLSLSDNNYKGPVKLTIFANSGRKLLQKEFSHNTHLEEILDLSQLNSGVYFIQFCFENRFFKVKKFIKF